MAVKFTCDSSQPTTPFPHVWELIVGSGHATLGLRADWQKQLARCRHDLGFKYVRFHGILSDDMGTLVGQNDKVVYSFFNATQIFDFLASIGMRPFVEMSFMPSFISSGGDTVFHYRGNVNPPRDYSAWEALINEFASHMLDRYGSEEIGKWFFEVWNEPNLKAFWTGSQQDYFTLYETTARALKAVDSGIQVGGPATAANAWLEDFQAFCAKSNVPADFISTHHYPTDAFGQPGDDTIAQLAASKRSVLREQVAASRKKVGTTPLYYTEWSTSSNPFDDLHDEPYAAAFVTKTVLESQPFVDGYSYWTFSDIFEENYFSSVPFHGGFGLMTMHGIPKPVYRAYELMHRLGTEALSVAGAHATVDVWITKKPGAFVIMMTNSALPKHPVATEAVRLEISGISDVHSVFIERIDEENGNARSHWQEMGAPGNLSVRQVEALEAASGVVKRSQSFTVNKGVLAIELTVPPQGTVCLTVEVDQDK